MSAPAGPRTRYSVDPWDPGYGVALRDELEETGRGGGGLEASSAQLDLDLEVLAGRWRPIDPDPAVGLPPTLAFLDGVRRIDARIWVHGGTPQPSASIAASFAAGLVRCAVPGGRPPREAVQGGCVARVCDVAVERGLFTTSADAADIGAGRVRYIARKADGGGPEKLSLALQQRLTETEVELAQQFRARHHAGDDLLIVDGPLRGRTHLERTVGYIKTHHTSYLPAAQAAVVASLAPGQRSPVFTMGTSWRRNSWYLRLPGAPGAPWSGVVRLECPADLPATQSARLADVTARLLPPLASAPHKDPRAPQNLVPIGGLERELRHRLGDRELLYRTLRAAAGA
ncbi:MAG: DNA double-strand break repair nuclease NurA [Micromonosporaceae bacterium]